MVRKALLFSLHIVIPAWFLNWDSKVTFLLRNYPKFNLKVWYLFLFLWGSTKILSNELEFIILGSRGQCFLSKQVTEFSDSLFCSENKGTLYQTMAKIFKLQNILALHSPLWHHQKSSISSFSLFNQEVFSDPQWDSRVTIINTQCGWS